MALLLFYAFVFGMIMGALYDISDVVRVLLGEHRSGRAAGRISQLRLPILKRPVRLREHSVLRNTVTFMGDLLCILCIAAGIVALNYGYNSGEFRAFTMIGTVGGFFLYRLTLGRLVMMMAEPLALLLKYLFFSFFIIFGYPFAKIGQLTIKKMRKMFFLYSFTLEKKRKKVYNVAEGVYLLKMADSGFLSCPDSRGNRKK